METHKQLYHSAKDAEDQKDFKAATKAYETLLKEDPVNEKLMNKLMVLYRKLKDYKKELSIINKAIKLELQHYTSRSKGKTVSELSKKLNMAMGLIDKKGNSTYSPPAVLRLEKRRDNLLTKMS